MMCLGNIGNSIATTNEEYKKRVGTRIRLMAVLCLAGLAMLALGIYSEFFSLFPATHQQSTINGIFTGAGTALVVVSIMRTVRFRKLLRDEEALKLARLEESDERNRFIAQNALRISVFVLLAACYICMIAGALSGSTAVFYSFFAVIILFFICYLVLYYMLQKKI